MICAIYSNSTLSSFPCVMACAAIITVIAYAPIKAKDFCGIYTAFLISSMLLSGGTMLFTSEKTYYRIILCMIGVSCLLFFALTSLRSRIYSRHMACEIVYKSYKTSLIGFYDSGNRLFASGGDLRVIIADESVLKMLFDKSTTASNLKEWADNVTEIPFCSAVSGSLVGFTIDYAIVDSKKYTDVFLAVSKVPVRDKLILHSTML